MARDALHPLASASDVRELDGDTDPEDARAAIAGADRIDIRFSGFKDGRGFSLAALLRRFGYEGQLNAVGPLLPDQIDDLRRVGFDHIHIDRSESPSRNRNTGGASYVYQPDPGAPSRRPTAMHQRALAARKARAEALADQLEGASPETILQTAIKDYGGRMAMLSSFGAEAALGLSLVAETAKDTPVLFLDTGQHFPQTLTYRDRLAKHLGLTRLQILRPEPDALEAEDPDNRLYETDSLACCTLRKVRPLARALDPFDALITGRKRYHGGARKRLQAIEFDGERVKVNPFAFLSPEEVAARFRALDLPSHPLFEDGYSSIGCWPCTAPSGETGSRAGRWAGQNQDECGIFDPARVARAERVGAIRLI